jgi:hypothetical protein
MLLRRGRSIFMTSLKTDGPVESRVHELERTSKTRVRAKEPLEFLIRTEMDLNARIEDDRRVKTIMHTHVGMSRVS